MRRSPFDVDRRKRGILVDEVRVRPRWEDRVRETQGQISKSTSHGICRRNPVEKEASRRTAREIDVHVGGGWYLLGCQSDDGGGHRGKSKRRVVDENCSEKPRQREMGSKQFGNGCGGPMAQKTRMLHDRWRTSQKRSESDG